MEEHLKFLGYSLIEIIPQDDGPSYLTDDIYRIETPYGEELLSYGNLHGGSALHMTHDHGYYHSITCFVDATIVEALYLILPHSGDSV